MEMAALWDCALACCIDKFEVFLEEFVDEDGELHAPGLGQRGEAGLHRRIQIDRQIQLRAGLEELAALTLREVDLGGHIVIGV